MTKSSSPPTGRGLSPYETALVVLGTWDLNNVDSFELAIVEEDDNPTNNALVVEQPTEGYVTAK